MKTEIEKITPDVARAYLKCNVKNRKINDSHLDFLASEIIEGRWVKNGATIVFSETGKLLDGQHRLMATIRANIPIETLVARGVDESAFSNIDVNKVRSASDVFYIYGEKNPGLMAATIRFLFKWSSGNKIKNYSRKPSPERLHKYLLENPDVRDSVKFVASETKYLINQPLLASLHYLFSKKDSILADEFVLGLKNGFPVNEHDPFYLLRENLIKSTMSKRTILLPQYVLGLVIKAWNYKRDMVEVSNLKFTVEKEEIQDIK